MKKFRNYLLILISFSFIMLFIFSSCKDNGTTPPSNNVDSCADHVNRGDSWIGPNFNGYIADSYTLGSERYFNFYVEYDSICTDHHITSFFSAIAKDTIGRPIKFRSAVEWLIFFERTDTGEVTISGGERTWRSGIYDVGLKQAFGEDPANVFVNVYVHFPTLGNEADDRAFLSRNLIHIIVSCDLYYHKP